MREYIINKIELQTFMKMNKLFLGLFVGVILGACSNDELGIIPMIHRMFSQEMRLTSMFALLMQVPLQGPRKVTLSTE